MRFVFDAVIWLWQGDGAWHFVTVPADVSDEIRDTRDGPRRGFGAVRTTVTIGGSEWQTSMFPDSKSGCYILPVKKAVRKSESLEVGDSVEVIITVS